MDDWAVALGVASVFVAWTGFLVSWHYSSNRSLRDELSQAREEKNGAEAKASALEKELKTVYNEKWLLMSKLLKVGNDQ